MDGGNGTDIFYSALVGGFSGGLADFWDLATIGNRPAGILTSFYATALQGLFMGAWDAARENDAKKAQRSFAFALSSHYASPQCSPE